MTHKVKTLLINSANIYQFNINTYRFLTPLTRLAKEWALQHECNILVSTLDRQTLSLEDILRFVLHFERHRRNAKRPVSKPLSEFIAMSRRALLTWLTKWADKSVLVSFLNNATSTTLAAPALQFRRSEKRKYCKVSVEAKWSILETARRTRANACTVLAVKSESAELGCNEQAADVWMRKEHEIYAKNTAMVLAGDGSGHASQFLSNTFS